MTIEYTETEKALISYICNMNEIHNDDIESIARDIDDGEDVWIAIELGRCPSTDLRTYILHVTSEEPRFDYYGAELINKKILGLEK